MTLLARPNGSRIDRLLAVPLALLLIAGPGSLDAWALNLSWKAAVSGNAGTASNWNPSGIPAPADTTTYNVAGTYTVTFPATVPSTNSHVYRTGNVTLVATSGHSTGNVVRVGSVTPDVATLTLTNALLTVGSFLTIGNNTGATGTVNVNAPGADLLQSGTAADVIVGSSGNGTLNVTNGGLVDAADDVLVGNGTGSQGTLLVSGVGGTQERSTVTSSGSDGDVLIGNGGTGTATVNFGGELISSDDLRIGTGGAGHGSLTVQNALGAFVSRLTVGDDLDIANNDVGGFTAGTGTLLLQNFGQVNVTDRTRVGDPDGGSGTLSIRPTTFFKTRSLIVDNTHGVLDFQGGTLTVDGGLFDPAGTTLILDDPQFESVQLLNGATATFDGGAPAGYSLIIGESEAGGLRVDSGSHVTNLNGVIAVALAGGSNGVVDVYDSSLVDSVGTMVIGQGGFGELNVGSGSKVKLTDVYVAYSPGSNGFVDVAGAGTTLTLHSLDIGGHNFTAGGGAFVGVHDGGLIDMVGGLTQPIELDQSLATLSVGAGGTVNAGSNLNSNGRVLMSGGQINVGALNLQNAGVLEGFGTVAGNIATTSPSNLIHAIGGTLTLGNTASNKGFANSGQMVIDTASVILKDADAAVLGNVVLHSGNLSLPSLGGTIGAGRTLSGNGLIGGGVTVDGTLAPGSSAGVIAIHGTYTQSAGGLMTMEIGDAPTGQYDRLSVTSTAALNGTLNIELLPGFVPDPGEDYTLISCGISRTGTFSSVTIHGQPVGGQFTINYNPATVVLHVNQITTDVPGPGSLPRAVALVARSGTSSNAGFELALPEASRVVLRLYSVSGRCLGTLFEGEHDAGVFALRLRDLDTKLAGGVYFGRMRVQTGATEQVRTAKVTLVR